MTFTARYPGRCSNCREAIAPGHVVDYLDVGRLAHIDCDQPSPENPLTATDPVICGRCHLAKPCECDDLTREGQL